MKKAALFYDLSNYKIIEFENGKIEDLCWGKNGFSTSTSAWMNRYPIYQEDDYSYIIIPSMLEHKQDNVVSTSEPFSLIKISEGQILDFTEEDAKHFISIQPQLFTPNTRYEQQMDYLKGMSMAMVSTKIADSLLKNENETVLNNLIERAGERNFGIIKDYFDTTKSISNTEKELLNTILELCGDEKEKEDLYFLCVEKVIAYRSFLN